MLQLKMGCLKEGGIHQNKLKKRKPNQEVCFKSENYCMLKNLCPNSQTFGDNK